ncbi:p115 like vesicle tethering protein [Aspergillus karnatakaensis]|uniref:p115 like vesicle tethering protein n=1 Tax=Aspergillus karnatakaensis TaxID=1810916 RepID=UPI003CCCA84D
MFQISSGRPERTQECILTAPLGIPRLVSALADAREPVRNEALLLLIALTPGSEELQKLVAFENAFESVCSLIESEGGLTHGSEVVGDCLSLLANLLKLNIPNQSYFRETGCIPRLAKLLAEVNKEDNPDEPTPEWALAQRDRNVWGLLVIIQLFLVKGGVNTAANQMAFWNSGVMEQVLSTAFGQRFTVNVTAKALATCADLIRGNQPLQERFGDVEVFWGAGQANDGVNGTKSTKPLPRINVIEALLKLSLEPAPIQLLDARLAACDCVKAFFTNHTGIRVHVLGRAINGHVSGQDEIPNILTVLITPPELRRNADPYQVWMASILMFHLLFENAEAKSVAMGVTEGDAENGEEVITCIQSITGNLITGLKRGDDERISLGYVMLLCGWLFEDPDAVNDFLGEGSSIQSLLQETKHRGVTNVLVPGLCTILLGVIYEFSSKDSPIPRKTLHKLLLEQLGREQYIDRITRLRESPLIRDFEVLPQTIGANYEGGLPDIFFDRVFVEFLKDNFSRLLRAIDRDPGLEISVITNGVERGVSRELVDSLKSDVEEKNQAVQKLESELVSLRHKLEQEQAEHRKSRDTNGLELTRLQQTCDSLQKRHEQELSSLSEQHKQAQNDLLKQHGEQLRAIDAQLRETSADHERKSSKFKERHEAEVADLKKKIGLLESDLARVREHYGGETRQLTAVIEALKSEAGQAKEQHAGLNQTIQDLQAKASEAELHKSQVAELESRVEALKSEADKTREQHAIEVSELNSTVHDLQSKLDTAKQQHESEVTKLESANESIRSELNTTKEQSAQDVEAVREDYFSRCSALENRAQQAESEIERLETEARKAAQALEEAQKALEKAQEETKEKEEARKAAQSELEDLLIVFGDLETKRNENKKRLKDLGQEVSEDEDDEEDEEDEEDE